MASALEPPPRGSRQVIRSDCCIWSVHDRFLLAAIADIISLMKRAKEVPNTLDCCLDAALTPLWSFISC